MQTNPGLAAWKTKKYGKKDEENKPRAGRIDWKAICTDRDS